MAISPQRVTDLLHVWIQGRIFKVGEPNGAISGSIKSWMAAGRHFGKLQRHRAVSLRLHGFLVSCTSFLHAIEHSSIPAQKLSGT